MLTQTSVAPSKSVNRTEKNSNKFTNQRLNDWEGQRIQRTEQKSKRNFALLTAEVAAATAARAVAVLIFFSAVYLFFYYFCPVSLDRCCDQKQKDEIDEISLKLNRDRACNISFSDYMYTNAVSRNSSNIISNSGIIANRKKYACNFELMHERKYKQICLLECSIIKHKHIKTNRPRLSIKRSCMFGWRWLKWWAAEKHTHTVKKRRNSSHRENRSCWDRDIGRYEVRWVVAQQCGLNFVPSYDVCVV